jgi:hypothetical protein
MTPSCQSLRLSVGLLGIVLSLFGAANAAAPNQDDGELIDSVDRRNRTLEGFLRAEVVHALHHAHEVMGADPKQAESALQLLRDKIGRNGEIRPDVRAQLVDQIEAGLRSAHRQVAAQTERDLRAKQTAAEHAIRERTDRELLSEERNANRSMSQYQALMTQGRYRDAETLAAMAQETKPGQAAFRNAELTARMMASTATIDTLRDMRQRGYLDVMYQTELAHVPTADSPPILYPDPEVWQLLRQRRNKYRAVDVAGRGPNETKILAVLDEKTDIDFAERPLSDVIDYLKQKHGIEIQLDTRALAQIGVDGAATITRSVKGISLRSGLRLLLRDLDATFVIRHEVLLITSQAAADTMLSTRVYPVADLLNGNRYGRRGGMGRGLGGLGGGAGSLRVGGGMF